MKRKIAPARLILAVVAILAALGAIGVAVHSYVIKQRASGPQMEWSMEAGDTAEGGFENTITIEEAQDSQS